MVCRRPGSRLRLGAFGLLLALACAPEAAGPNTPAQGAADLQAVEPEERQVGTDEQLARAAVERTLHEVTRLRGLAPLRPVRTRVVGRDELVSAVRERMDQDVPPQVVEGTERALLALGVVPIDFDYRASLLTLLGAQLAGVYDPEADVMLLASDLEEEELRATLAHELVHALQDQHYDLGRRLEYREGEADAQSALHALAEGDATSTMADQMLAQRGMTALDLSDAELSENLRSSLEAADGTQTVPRVIKQAIIAPYADGIALVHWARRRGGWEEVNRLWREPPVSTEQLLHFDKLSSGEQPEQVAVPVAAAAGMQLTYQDVMGELSLRLVFEQWMETSAAQRAASQWAGDRLAVFRSGDRHGVVWHVRYDDAAAARRGLVGFGAGVVAAAEHEREAAEETVDGGGTKGARSAERVDAAAAFRAVESGEGCQSRSRRGPLAVVLRGRDVVLVAGPHTGSPPREAAGNCASALAWAKRVAGQS